MGLSFNKNNYQTHIANWNKKNDNKLTRWLESGYLVEIEKWHFIEKRQLTEFERELENQYSLLDLNIISINKLQNDIRYFCIVKSKSTRNLILDHFSNSPENDTIQHPFIFLCNCIISQPVYLLDAVEKTSDYLNENQKTFYRYKYVNSKLTFASDKFFLFRVELDRIVRKYLTKRNGKKILNTIFLFMEQFIDELRYHNPTHYNYLNSPLFQILYKEILKYKDYYIAAFENFNFPNIIELDTTPKSKGNKQNKITPLTTHLKPNQIDLLFNELTNKYHYIHKETEINCFRAIFSIIDFPDNFTPIKWIEAKSSCRWLLELLSDQVTNGKSYIPNATRENVIPELFVDRNGEKMKIGKEDNRGNDYHLDRFNKILDTIKEKTRPE